jgi:hypothetical protein
MGEPVTIGQGSNSPVEKKRDVEILAEHVTGMSSSVVT